MSLQVLEHTASRLAHVSTTDPEPLRMLPITVALMPWARATSTAVSVSSASTTTTIPNPQLNTRTISSALT